MGYIRERRSPCDAFFGAESLWRRMELNGSLFDRTKEISGPKVARASGAERWKV